MMTSTPMKPDIVASTEEPQTTMASTPTRCERQTNLMASSTTHTGTNHLSPMPAVFRSKNDVMAMKQRTKRKSDVRRANAKTPIAKRTKPSTEGVTVAMENSTSLFMEDQKPAAKNNTVVDTKFDQFSSIFPILQGLGFQRSYAGGYKHPWIETHLDTPESMQKYMCQHGIPNVNQLNDEERKMVEKWAKFAHVPLKDVSRLVDSIKSTRDLDDTSQKNLGENEVEILPDSEIEKLLPTLGFETGQLFGKTHILAPGASDLAQRSVYLCEGVHYFQNLDAVRVYVRSNEILAVEDPSGGRRTRCRKKAIDYDPSNQLAVRLWGATSDEPLPTFHCTASVPVSPKGKTRGEPQVRAPAAATSARKARDYKQQHDDDDDDEEVEARKPSPVKKLQSTSSKKQKNKDDTPSTEPLVDEGPPPQQETQIKTEHGSTNLQGDQGQEQKSEVNEEDRHAKRKLYRRTRLDIMIQRRVLDKLRSKLDLSQHQEAEVLRDCPEGYDIDFETKKLQGILETIRCEIQSTLEMNPFEEE